MADESIISKYIKDEDMPQEHLRDAVAILYGGKYIQNSRDQVNASI
jgi:hypothetical protein